MFSGFEKTFGSDRKRKGNNKFFLLYTLIFLEIPYDEGGLEAIIFTAEGDMRQAINSLQATFTGFGEIRKDFVFRVCDVPNIDVIKKVLQNCIDGDFTSVH